MGVCTKAVPSTRDLAWHVTRVELDDVWLVRVKESGPRLRHVELEQGRTFLSFLARPGPDVSVGGMRALVQTPILSAMWNDIAQRIQMAANLQIRIEARFAPEPRLRL